MPPRAKPIPGQILPPAKPRHGERAAPIRKLHMRYPELSGGEIARHVGCSRQNVNQVLAVFLDGHSEAGLRDFQANKADVYHAIQRRALESVTRAKLQKSSAPSLVTAAVTLEDKARLIRGQAAGINVQVLLDVAEMIRNERDAGR